MFIIDIVSLGNYSFRYLKYLKAILHQDTYKNKLRRRPKSLIDSEQMSLARMDYKKEKFQTTAPLWEFQQYWYSFPTLRFIMTINSGENTNRRCISWQKNIFDRNDRSDFWGLFECIDGQNWKVALRGMNILDMRHSVPPTTFIIL